MNDLIDKTFILRDRHIHINGHRNWRDGLFTVTFTTLMENGSRKVITKQLNRQQLLNKMHQLEQLNTWSIIKASELLRHQPDNYFYYCDCPYDRLR